MEVNPFEVFNVKCVKCGKEGRFSIYKQSNTRYAFIVYHGKPDYCYISKADEEDVKLLESVKDQNELKNVVKQLYNKAVQRYLKYNEGKIYRRLYIYNLYHSKRDVKETQ